MSYFKVEYFLLDNKIIIPYNKQVNMNLVEIFTKFPKQENCIAFLEEKRWHNKTVCPYCGSCKSSKESGLRHHCNKCNTSYSVLVNTIFHHTHLPLQKWFLAISLIVNAKKGISSRQLARNIKVTKDTAWRMQMQIQQAIVETPSLMTGICEIDETYIGGKFCFKYNNRNNKNIFDLLLNNSVKNYAYAR